MVAAAVALAAWARERQSGWDDAEHADEGVDVAPAVSDAPPIAEVKPLRLVAQRQSVPDVTERPAVPEMSAVPADGNGAEPPAPVIDRPVFVRPGGALFADEETIEDAGPSWFERVRPYSFRAAAALLVVAAVVGGGVKARAYLQRQAAMPKTGVAVLESLPAGSEVLVDGRPVGVTPVTTTLPAGPHAVEFRYRDATRTAHIVVPLGGRTSELYDWTRKPTGGVHVATTPAGARVLIDGEPRGIAPISVSDLVAGTHTVVLEGVDGTIRRSIVIKEGETAQVAETFVAGWVSVFAPFEVTVKEGNRALSLDDRGQLMLPPGTHQLTFENRQFGYRQVHQVAVDAGKQTALSLVPPRSALTVNANEVAEVWVDGVLVGATPLVASPIELGTRELLVKNASGAERRYTLTVTSKPMVVTIDFQQ